MKNAIVIIGLLLFYSCNQTTTIEPEAANESKNVKATYLEKGKTIVQSSQKVLASNLMQAIQQDGAPYALSFCNTQAIHLTDSMSHVWNATIKRVSDKARNPNNAANATEIAYITKGKEALINGENIAPEIIEKDGHYIGYYPIYTNAMCLQCHGNIQTDIEALTLEKINELYPNDKATGYGSYELRGLWVVTMNQ